MNQSGMFWHVHHDRLLEYCWSYDTRVEFIKEHKPKHEQETRLKLFKPVQAELPTEITKACAALTEINETLAEAQANAPWEVVHAVMTARNKADTALREAIEDNMEAIEDNRDAILELHAKECPDCTWDGTMIHFPGE